MAKANLKNRKRRIIGWTIGGMLSVILLITVAGVYAFGPFAPFVLAWLLMPKPWYSVVVPLPDERGKIAIQFRSSHPFLAEYHKRIDIRLVGRRRLRSPIVGNTGGGTFLLLFWQPERQRAGPFLMLEDKKGATLIDIRNLCLYDSFKGIDAIAVEDRCPYEILPTSFDWTYYGRIEAKDGDRHFIPGDQWPPGDTDVPWYFWPARPPPGSRWSFDFLAGVSAGAKSSNRVRQEGVDHSVAAQVVLARRR